MTTSETLLGPRYKKRKSYCVLGCDDLEDVPMHRFPHPERAPELLKSWLSMVGHKMKETDSRKIYNNKRICDHHFTSNQKASCHRLIYEAVPTVNFDGVFLSTHVLEHNYCLPKQITPSSPVLESSSGIVPHTEKGYNFLKEHNYYHNGDPEDGPATANQILFVDISGLWEHFLLLKEFGN